MLDKWRKRHMSDGNETYTPGTPGDSTEGSRQKISDELDRGTTQIPETEDTPDTDTPQELTQQEKDEQCSDADKMIANLHEAKRRIDTGEATSIEDAVKQIDDEREQEDTEDEDEDKDNG